MTGHTHEAWTNEATFPTSILQASNNPVKPCHDAPILDRESVDAFDDAEVALDAVGEGDQRLLVGLALVGRDGLFKAVELDQDSALGDSGVVCDDPTAKGEGPPAPGPDGWTGQFVVGSQLLGVGNGAVGTDPVFLGHGTSSVLVKIG